jgi:hypothetical protein
MEVNFNWKPFKGRGAKIGSYEISVMKTGAKGKSGGFGFLSGFYKKENLNDNSYVSLFYDEEKETIGFIFNNDKDYPGAFKLTKGKGSASVFPNSFWSGFSVDIGKWAGRYAPKQSLDEKLGKIYYIQLKEKIEDDK